MGTQIIPLPYKHALRQFGARLQQVRKAQDISQEALAEKIGVHRTYLSLVEKGQRNPSLRVIYRIVKALKIHSGDLLPF